MESRRIQHIGIVSLIMLSMMGVVSSQVSVLAQDSSDPNCTELAKSLVGYREAVDGEIGTGRMVPPFVPGEDCTTMKFFDVTVVLGDENGPEAIQGQFPRGRYAFEVVSGTISVSLATGTGYVQKTGCTVEDLEGCQIQLKVDGDPVDMVPGDSFFLSYDESEGAPLDFTLTFVSVDPVGGSASVNGNRQLPLLNPGKASGRGSGSGDANGGVTTLGCDTGKCF